MPRIFASIVFTVLLCGCAASLVPQYRSDELFGRVQAGMTEEEVAKVCAGNWLRVFRAVRG